MKPKKAVTPLLVLPIMIALIATAAIADVAAAPNPIANAIELKPSADEEKASNGVLTLTLTNPLPRQIRGAVKFYTSSDGKPVTEKLRAAQGKSVSIDYRPEYAWDGFSKVTATAEVRIDGIDEPVLRTLDIDASKRITASATAPLGKVIEFRIINPGKSETKGKFRIHDVKGVSFKDTTFNFTVEGQTVISAPLNEPAPSEYSFSYSIDTIHGKTVLRSPVLQYTVIEDFANTVEQETVTSYDTALEGDDSVQANVTALAARRQSSYVAMASIPSYWIRYEFQAGDRILRIAPLKELPAPADPIELGMWIEGDRSGHTAYARLTDSTGRIFRTHSFKIDWSGWRYAQMSLRSLGSGGERPEPPLRWDSILVIDCGGQASRGTVYLGPMAVVSLPKTAIETPDIEN